MDTIGAGFGVVLLAALVGKLTDFLRYIAGAVRGEPTAKSSIVTQLIAWAAGIGAVLLFTATAFADGVALGGVELAKANFATQMLAGLMVASFISQIVDIRKSLDSTQTAAVPRLIKPRLKV